MSLTKGKRIRCDFCGKLTSNRQGEYTRPDGGCGYINDSRLRDLHDDFKDGADLDSCEECDPSLAEVLAAARKYLERKAKE